MRDCVTSSKPSRCAAIRATSSKRHPTCPETAISAMFTAIITRLRVSARLRCAGAAGPCYFEDHAAETGIPGRRAGVGGRAGAGAGIAVRCRGDRRRDRAAWRPRWPRRATACAWCWRRRPAGWAGSSPRRRCRRTSTPGSNRSAPPVPTAPTATPCGSTTAATIR